MLRQRIRQVLSPLLNTPFHPQWLVARQGRRRTGWIKCRAIGSVLDVGCAGSAIKSTLTGAATYCGLDYPTTAMGMYGTRPDVFGDGSCLPFLDRSFDTVLLLDVLEHVSEPELALSEAQRVLRPGGKLLITIPFAYPLHDQPHDYQRFTEHGIGYRLRKTGLKLVQICEVGTASEAASGNLAMALSQGAICALSARSWRTLWLPLLPPLIFIINLFGWLSAKAWPARGFLPGAYYVEALRV